MKQNFNWRVNLIVFVFLAIGAAIIGRLFDIQILNRKHYDSQAIGQQTSLKDIAGVRGQIFSSGEVKSLAINKDNWTLAVNPKNIEDKNILADVLDDYIGKTKEEILTQINKETSYVVLSRNLSEKIVQEIKTLNISGIIFEKTQNRFYPQYQMASHVLGFVGGEKTGQYGIEGYYEYILKGKQGLRETRIGLEAYFLGKINDNEEALKGSDIYLTIDPNIQLQAEALLLHEKEKSDIDSGQIIVMRPESGEILAMAVFPNFDLNAYSKVNNLETFQNPLIQKLFEPGSVIKPFTMAVAINEGKITPDTKYEDEGFIKIGKDTISNYNFKKYGEQTMTEALEKSINTGAVFAQQKVDNKVFWDYFDKFGFFQKTGIDSTGEVSSKNELLKKGPNFNYATASFGQGIEMTPIQLIKAYSVLANKGKLVKPYLVEKIITNTEFGEEITYTKPDVSRPVILEQTALQVNAMLVNVVEKGLPKVVKIPGYYLAGKTGTAQIPLANGKGYEPDSSTIQSFVGYGPAYSPKFLILVKLDKPKVPVSTLSAAPLFKELAKYIINYWQIPPDYDPEEEK